MALRAYMLIEAQAGKAEDVIALVSVLPYVKSADSVTGPYDGIADIEVADLDALGRVVGEINLIPGIVKTITCIRMKFSRLTSRG